MGNKLFDQYSLLHAACGVIAYFWNVSLLNWLIFHTIFEIIENTELGMQFINKMLPFWPGGKPEPDAILNRFGDTIGAVVGWVIAKQLDVIGTRKGWYSQHIKSS